MTSRTRALPVVLVAMFLAGRAHAVSKTWIGSDGGTFATSTNWDPSGTPGTADSILFAAGAVASSYDINFDANSTVTQLTVATNPLVFAGPSRTLSLTSTETYEGSRALMIGRTGSGTASAVLSTSLAQLNTAYATLGFNTGSSGTLNVNSGTFNVTGTSAFSDLVIGESGTGAINVNNGADVTVAGDTGLATFGGVVGNISVFGTGSTWTSTGSINYLKGGGTITVAGGGALSASSLSLGFGVATLAGNGTVTAPVTNNKGTVSPSSLTSGYGTLQINGNYTQGASGILKIEINGTSSGTFDRLSVSGAVNLDGTLQVTLQSFTPAQNNTFDILDFTSRLNTFATLNLPALPGSLEWDTSKLYIDGTIRVVLPGDFNNSGLVDVGDYAVWRKGLGTTYTASDLDVWRSRFGRSATGAGSSLGTPAAIPEPTTLTLVLLTIGTITTGRRLQRNPGH